MKNYLLVILIAIGFSVNAQNQNHGKASYIGDKFQGLKMASGEMYDGEKMIAAHRTLPFGTKVKVTNISIGEGSGNSVIVTIKDRGPFVRDRIIDVSRAAARQLGFVKSGTATVRIEVVGAGSTSIASDNSTTEEAPKSRTIEPKTIVESKPIQPKSSVENTAKSGNNVPKEYNTTTEKPKTVAPVKITPKVNINKAKSPTGLFKVDVENQTKNGFGVQIGIFTGFEVLLKQVATLKGKGFKDVLISVSGTGSATKYRIILGQFDNQNSATAYKKALKSKYKMDGFIVDFSEL